MCRGSLFTRLASCLLEKLDSKLTSDSNSLRGRRRVGLGALSECGALRTVGISMISYVLQRGTYQ